MDELRFDTWAVHAGRDDTDTTGGLIGPIYPSVGYVRRSLDEAGPFGYQRLHNPTRAALERALARLHAALLVSASGRAGAVAFASGMAAVTAVAQLLESGDHVLLPDDVYGNTHRLYTLILPGVGIQADFVDMTDLSAVEAALRPTTRLVWIETPTNPSLKIVDIAAVSDLAHRVGALAAVDNSFSSPYFQRPLELGADLVMESSTKYLNGHDDLMGGAVLMRSEALLERVAFLQYVAGAVPSPFDCWLLLRGLKTLPLRMERHQQNALRVARFLQGHPRVARVFYPGLEDHPGHELARSQMHGFGGMVSFELDGDHAAVRRAVEGTRLFALAAGLGGVESLIAHPLTMTHPSQAGSAMAPSYRLIRLSVGIEAADDLLADLDQALARA
jgi:cystathionine beta-lyase/cystathionine gamma-synthase